jgi:formylglycine-generating enzyme required for sulfatase activity
MGGNVWQWCEDSYDERELGRALRGASWLDANREILLASNRGNGLPGYRSDNVGFRCVVGAEPSRQGWPHSLV